MNNITPVLIVGGLLLVLTGAGAYFKPMGTFFDYTSEGGGRRAMISSLFILHIILGVVVLAIYQGKNDAILFQVYDKTLDAIVWNLAIITADKGAAVLADMWARVRGTPVQRAVEKTAEHQTTQGTTDAAK